jgi:cytochrome c-type biogenesis protein CcmH/NrfG
MPIQSLGDTIKGREAEEAFRKAIDLDPGNVSARNGLALLKMDQGYFTQAGEELSLALEADPARLDGMV